MGGGGLSPLLPRVNQLQGRSLKVWVSPMWPGLTCHLPPSVRMQRLLSGPWVPGSGVTGQALAVAPDGKLLFSGGHWDGSLRVTALPRGKLLNQLSRHLDVVTCLALDTCGIYLISGSRDTTCMVWRLLQQVCPGGGGQPCGRSCGPDLQPSWSSLSLPCCKQA